MANPVFSYVIFYFYVFKQEILPHILASGWSLTFLHSSTILDSDGGLHMVETFLLKVI